MEKSQAEILLEKIKEHNNAYRAGIPIVSDKEYDKEVESLKKIDPCNDWFKHIEPAPVGEARKVKLPVQMKSLNKVKDIASLLYWTQSIGLNDEDMVIITPKFDGLSLLHNEHNNKTYSRGGAENEGQDCTAHYIATNIISNCSKLDYTYGEFVFSRASWESNFAGKKSPETGDKYKSPRNTAAGLLNRDLPSDNLKYVDFFRYGTDEKSLSMFQSYVDLFTYLCRTFDQQFLYCALRVKDLNEEYLTSCFKNWSKEYYIDGLVLYANDFSIWKRVGRQENTGNPNYAIAYKDPNFTDTFETKVKGINWKISKSGALKPVVSIDTVDTGDCEMENPTGYNAKYIFDNKIGKGALISVTRSGGVIPKILEVITPATESVMNDLKKEVSICKDCKKPMEWNASNVELCCTNPNCNGIKLAKIIFFYTTIGVDNIGEETINKMFNAGYTSLKYMLNITFDELMRIDGFGESIANAVISNNKKILKGVEVSLLMHASDCFQGIGQTKAKKILENMKPESVWAFINGQMKYEISKEEYNQLNKTLQSFIDGIQPFYEFVASNGLTILAPESTTPTSNKYQGIKVCFTGVRDLSLEKDIVLGGGDVVSGVSKKTTHLIVADLNSTSEKTKKAKKLGVAIMTMEAFKSTF